MVIGQIPANDACLLVAAAEFVILFLIGKERIHTADLKLHVELSGQTVRHLGEEDMIVFVCVHGAAHGGEQVGIIQIYGVFVVEIEGAHKGCLELRKEMQGAAQKRDVAADGLAAGKSAYSLVDDSLENGGGQVFLCGAFIDQGLNVGFGEDTAARSDGVERAVSAGIAVKPCRISLQKAGHLVDKGACAACTDTVHSLFDAAVFKVDDLSVFSSQFDRDIGFGSNFLKSGGDRDYFLDKGYLKVCRQGQSAGTCDDRVDCDIPQPGQGVLNKTAKSSLNVRVMSAVVGKHDFIRRIQDGDFDRRGSDIDSKCIVF